MIRFIKWLFLPLILSFFLSYKTFVNTCIHQRSICKTKYVLRTNNVLHWEARLPNQTTIHLTYSKIISNVLSSYKTFVNTCSSSQKHSYHLISNLQSAILQRWITSNFLAQNTDALMELMGKKRCSCADRVSSLKWDSLLFVCR